MTNNNNTNNSNTTTRRRRIRRPLLVSLLFLLLVWGTLPTASDAWKWSDWVGSTSTAVSDVNNNNDALTAWSSTSTLSFAQVSELRVRDIKRRLARTHGYSAEELAKMILKKELVEALAFEEEKVRLKLQDDLQRFLFWKSVLLAVICVVTVMCWPLIQQGFEVAAVNFVVYTDRKKLEARRCWELKTKWGMLGVICMFIIDLLQAWLTVSILLSWVMRSKYFFPTPNIPIRPAQFMGGPMEKAFGGYGINVGSMVVTWLLRVAHAQLERWTGQALSAAMRKQKKRVKKKSSSEAERTSRRQARREARAAMPPHLPPQWMEPNTTDNSSNGNHPDGQEGETPLQQQAPTPPAFPTSKEHEEFTKQLETEASGLDELD